MQELLYTSVPRGLKPGSRGFCTVLSTQNMVAPLAVALEGLSAYRPVFPIGHARVAENPVVYSHLKLQVAGKSWYVLSRVADYGLDYSQRTNKLAHHLVLDKSELPTAGPASLLRTAGIMRESWEGDPKVVPPKPISRQPSTPTGVCLAWKDMTGDAGWAGVLAESFLKDPARPVILLFEPGQDLRSLIDESLSLLPPEKRWDVTFSTYFTGSSQGITCLWRGIVLGSKEATESLRFVNALRIDLTSTDLGRADGGELVEAARKGTRPSARPTPPKQAAPREQQQPRVVVIDDAEQPTVYRSHPEEVVPEPRATPIAGHDLSQAPPRLTPSVFKFANARKQTDSDGAYRRTSGRRKPVLILGVVLLLSSSILAGWFLISLPKDRQKNLANALTSDATHDTSAIRDPKVDGMMPSAKSAPSVNNDSSGESVAVAANNSAPPDGPKPEAAPPKDKAATYKIELDPPQAEFEVQGDGAVVTGDGKQRTVTIQKPESTKTVILIAKLQGYQEGRHELHPMQGVTENIAIALKPDSPPKTASRETKLIRLELPIVSKAEATTYSLETDAAKSAKIACWIPKFEKQDGFGLRHTEDGSVVLHDEGIDKAKTVANVKTLGNQLIFKWADVSDALKQRSVNKLRFCYLEIREGKSVSHRITFLPEPTTILDQPPKGPIFKLISDSKSELGRVLAQAEELKLQIAARNVAIEFEKQQWPFTHSKEQSKAKIISCDALAKAYGQKSAELTLELSTGKFVLGIENEKKELLFSSEKTEVVNKVKECVRQACENSGVEREKEVFQFHEIQTKEKQTETIHTINQWFLNKQSATKDPKEKKTIQDARDGLGKTLEGPFETAINILNKCNEAPKKATPIKTQSTLISTTLVYDVFFGDSKPAEVDLLRFNSEQIGSDAAVP